MDTQNTTTHVHIKIYGRKEPITYTSDSIMAALMQANGTMARVSAAFRGETVIRISPHPITDEDKIDPAAGIDPGLMTQDDRLSDWIDVMQGDSDLKQYVALKHRSNYDRTPQQKVWELEEYVRDKYSETEWWGAELKEINELVQSYKPRLA